VVLFYSPFSAFFVPFIWKRYPLKYYRRYVTELKAIQFRPDVLPNIFNAIMRFLTINSGSEINLLYFVMTSFENRTSKERNAFFAADWMELIPVPQPPLNTAEPVFVNVHGVQESISRKEFRQLGEPVR
jgi:hypothetical protein